MDDSKNSNNSGAINAQFDGALAITDDKAQEITDDKAQEITSAFEQGLQDSQSSWSGLSKEMQSENNNRPVSPGQSPQGQYQQELEKYFQDYDFSPEDKLLLQTIIVEIAQLGIGNLIEKFIPLNDLESLDNQLNEGKIDATELSIRVAVIFREKTDTTLAEQHENLLQQMVPGLIKGFQKSRETFTNWEKLSEEEKARFVELVAKDDIESAGAIINQSSK